MSIRGISLAAMLLVGGIGSVRGAEVQADLVCNHGGPTTAYYADPCCRPGPVRRFLRRVFHPCCPTVPVARYAPVVVPCPQPVRMVIPYPQSAPQAWVPPGAPVMLDRPVPPQTPIPSPPPMDVPSSGGALRRESTPTPPVRFDRIASRVGDEGLVQATPRQLVTLVQVGKPDSRKQAETDATGRFSVELTPGTWVVYVKDEAGKSVEQGRLVIREQKVIRVRIAEAG